MTRQDNPPRARPRARLSEGAQGLAVLDVVHDKSAFNRLKDPNELTEREKVGTGWTYFGYDENGSLLRDFDADAGTTTYFAYSDNGLVSRMKPPYPSDVTTPLASRSGV
jgi:hypothetical protein